MNWWILVFMVSCAAALPQERPHHVRKVVTHRRVPVASAPPYAASRIPQPVKVANSAKRIQAVRVVPAVRPTAVKATTVPLRSPIPPPVRTPTGVKRVTAIKKVPAIKPYPGLKALSKEESEALKRQIQQWQIAVLGGAVPPPGPAGPPGPPGTAPPVYPAGPGTIWIQVPSGGYPSYPGGYPPYPGPPSLPSPPPPATSGPAPPIPDEAHEGSAQPVPEAPPTEEGVPPQEETPAGGEEAGGEVPAEGVAPEEEIPTDGVAPEEEVPAVPEGEAPTEEVPEGGETPPEEVAPEEEVPQPAPEGELPAEEKPAEGGAPAGGEPAAPGDEEEDKLVHCKEERGQFSHESSCSKFYNCWDDVVIEQSCPMGLAFSEEHSYCDFPENVDCGEKTLDAPSMPIEENGGCSSPYGSYRSKTNCSEFFICVNGVPVQFACPDSLSYNQDLGVCDYPYRVDCENPPAPETPPEEATGGEEAAPEEPPAPEQPEEQPSEPAPPAEESPSIPDGVRGLPASFLKAGSPCWHNNVYPLNTACSRVSVCRSGTTSILACPKGMAYDKYKRRCLPYYRVRC